MNIFPENIKAVLFDMDGVLYDSMKNHADTWVGSFRRSGIDFKPEEAYMNEGRTGNGTISLTYKKYLNREATEEEKEAIYREKVRLMADAPEAGIYPGMQELVEKLRESGIECLVVTGSRQPTLLGKLKNDFGFESDQIVSGHDVKKGKPHPEPYLIALQRSGHKNSECVVIENAPLGIQSAKCAGIYTIAVNTGILDDKVLVKAGADELYHDAKELSERLLGAFKDVGENKR
jgi:HAD superfamily hydrolase (TIGR01509 family)